MKERRGTVNQHIPGVAPAIRTWWDEEIEDEEDVSGCFQAPILDQCPANGPQERSNAVQQHRDDIPAHFAHAAQSAGTSQTKAGEQAAQPPHPPAPSP